MGGEATQRRAFLAVAVLVAAWISFLAWLAFGH